MGKALERKEQWTRAQESYEEAIRLDARQAHFHYYLARLHEDAGRSKKALEHYRRYLELASSRAWPSPFAPDAPA